MPLSPLQRLPGDFDIDLGGLDDLGKVPRRARGQLQSPRRSDDALIDSLLVGRERLTPPGCRGSPSLRLMRPPIPGTPSSGGPAGRRSRRPSVRPGSADDAHRTIVVLPPQEPPRKSATSAGLLNPATANPQSPVRTQVHSEDVGPGGRGRPEPYHQHRSVGMGWVAGSLPAQTRASPSDRYAGVAEIAAGRARCSTGVGRPCVEGRRLSQRGQDEPLGSSGCKAVSF